MLLNIRVNIASVFKPHLFHSLKFIFKFIYFVVYKLLFTIRVNITPVFNLIIVLNKVLRTKRVKINPVFIPIKALDKFFCDYTVIL